MSLQIRLAPLTLGPLTLGLTALTLSKNHLPWAVKLGRDDKAQSSRRGFSGGLQDVAVPPVHVGDVDYAARCVDYEPELSPKLEDGPLEHAQLGMSEHSGHEDLMSERSGHQDL
jgi:hypothetical protein